MDLLHQKILAHTYTVASAHHSLGTLRHVLEQVFFVSDDSEETVEERYRVALTHLSDSDQRRLVDFGTKWLVDFSQSNLHQHILDLQKWLSEIPTITLYVPVIFEEEQIAWLGEWCRAEIDNQILLELVVDPATVGGCAFVHNHIYYDMSLRARIADMPDAVANVLKRYESA